jgi:hypothetical protein
MAKYELKEGVVLRPFGTGTITNENLTDDIAEWLLETGKLKKEQLKQTTTKTK